jgi:hypothetical protein
MGCESTCCLRPHLQQQKPAQRRAAEASRANAARNQQHRARETHDHSENGGDVQPFAARHGLDTYEPERRQRNDQARQTAGNSKLGKSEAAVADAQDQNAAQAGLPEILAARQSRSSRQRARNHDRAGKDEARRNQHVRGESFQAHANAKIRGAPEKADGE